ncbi:MAG: alpha/beta hydrolase [Sphingobacteriaceae bacterium]|nr:alpha/beta hydrolase [Sphingobacteriaceae bacterium]
MEKIFMTSVLNGNKVYHDAVNILEDAAVSQNWKPTFVNFPTPTAPQFFLGEHIYAIRSSKVIFFHTGKCSVVPNQLRNRPDYIREPIGLYLEGMDILLDSLVKQLEASYASGLSQELRNVHPELTPYVIIFLIIDKDSYEIDEAIKNALGIDLFGESRRLFYIVTLEANEINITGEEYSNAIPLIIRDFAEAFSSSNSILEQGSTRLDDLMQLFPGSKIHTTKIQLESDHEYENLLINNRKTLGGEIKLTTPQNDYSKPGDVYDIWFGTNRVPIDKNNYEKGFGNNRDTRINYGICSVRIPKSHKIGDGQPSFWRRLFGAEMMSVKKIKGIPATDFWNSVRSALRSLPQNDKSATIFVHGYNVDFEEAAIQTAQMLSDINLPGIFAFYSWPSLGTLVGYPADESTIMASVKFISEFIGNFATMADAKRINIIAHSMGNRGVLDAFERVLKKTFTDTGIKINQIILAAPDVDADVFNDLYEVYTITSKRTTIYVSNRDKALQASGFLHHYARTGLTPPVAIYKGLDTVFVGDIDLSLLGHGYVANSRIVLTDMHQLLLNNTEPSKRMGLKKEITPQGNYYKIIK